MARYIDADKIITDAIKERKFFIQSYDAFKQEVVVKTIYKDLAKFIDAQPTADVVEVKHGEWKHKRATIDGCHYFYCSECGREVSVNMYDNTSVTKFYPYCHCGAKMDGRSDT